MTRSLVDNDAGYLCTQCGDEVEKVQQVRPHDTNLCGTCDEDGIVYVTLDPDEVTDR